MSSLEYMAGLFDGEGHIGVYRYQGKNSPFGIYAQLNNTCFEVVDLFKSEFGGNVTHAKDDNPKHRAQAKWYAWRKNAAYALLALYPYLIVKRHEAEIVLPWLFKYSFSDADKNVSWFQEARVALIRRHSPWKTEDQIREQDSQMRLFA